MAPSGRTVSLTSLDIYFGSSSFSPRVHSPMCRWIIQMLHLSSLLQDISLYLLPCVASTAATEGE